MNEFEEIDAKIYPNPFNDFLKIETDEALNLEVFDLSGRKVFSQKLGFGKNELYLNKLVSGIYIAKFNNSKGQTLIKKIQKY